MSNDVAIHEIARSVACYLCENPRACDGSQGISRWWLAPGHAYADAEIERALSLLVQWGLVRITSATDGRVRYAVRDGQLTALRALCQTGDAPGADLRRTGV